MAEKHYEWLGGATLEEHSRRKHKILREYFFRYLTIRCQLPRQARFRLAIVDGFAGAGRYSCGTAGSPIIFLEELKRFTEVVNVERADRGLGSLELECLLILNDAERPAIEILKRNVAPLHGAIKDVVPKLHLRIEYLNESFEDAYPVAKKLLSQHRYRNVLFNLDQYGHRHVDRSTLVDIMQTYTSAEVFYTFAIEALFTFLRKSEPALLAAQLKHLGLGSNELKILEGAMNKNSWLGAAERLVFETFRSCAPFVSPFSINNPDGWRYWLIHFANFYKARQVYNNTLHDNSTMQAHFGRSGLNMLSYDPNHEHDSLYLFDQLGRQIARNQLSKDIPQLLFESGDALCMADFYQSIYNNTPAHTDDVHAAIIDNPDLEVITPAGGERRRANTIDISDVIKLKAQKSFFPIFNVSGRKGPDGK